MMLQELGNVRKVIPMCNKVESEAMQHGEGPPYRLFDELLRVAAERELLQAVQGK